MDETDENVFRTHKNAYASWTASALEILGWYSYKNLNKFSVCLHSAAWMQFVNVNFCKKKICKYFLQLRAIQREFNISYFLPRDSESEREEGWRHFFLMLFSWIAKHWSMYFVRMISLLLRRRREFENLQVNIKSLEGSPFDQNTFFLLFRLFLQAN